MNRIRVAVAVVLAAAACGDTTAPETELRIESSKSTYSAGEQIKLALRNATRDTIWVDHCSVELLYERAGTWEHVLGRDCPAIHDQVRRLSPGEQSADSIPTGADYPHGRYRTVVALRHSSAPMIVRYQPSNAFTLR